MAGGALSLITMSSGFVYSPANACPLGSSIATRVSYRPFGGDDIWELQRPILTLLFPEETAAVCCPSGYDLELIGGYPWLGNPPLCVLHGPGVFECSTCFGTASWIMQTVSISASPHNTAPQLFASPLVLVWHSTDLSSLWPIAATSAANTTNTTKAAARYPDDNIPNSSRTTAFLGIALAIVLFILMGVCICFCMRRRKRKRKALEEQQNSTGPDGGIAEKDGAAVRIHEAATGTEAPELDTSSHPEAGLLLTTATATATPLFELDGGGGLDSSDLCAIASNPREIPAAEGALVSPVPREDVYLPDGDQVANTHTTPDLHPSSRHGLANLSSHQDIAPGRERETSSSQRLTPCHLSPAPQIVSPLDETTSPPDSGPVSPLFEIDNPLEGQER